MPEQQIAAGRINVARHSWQSRDRSQQETRLRVKRQVLAPHPQQVIH